MLSRRSLLASSAAAACLASLAIPKVRRAGVHTIVNPQKPFIRVGVTLSLETFRANVVNEVFSGAGLPSGGFTTTTTNQTDPLTAFSLSPTNLSRYDAVTIDFKDKSNATVGTINGGIWRPSSGTKNNKLVVQMLGHGPFAKSLNPSHNHTSGNLVKLLVEGGYTVCVYEMPFHGNLASHNALPWPTAALNPLRYFVEAPIKAINALLPEGFNSNVLYCGHSGGGWVGPLLMAMDTRIRAGDSNAGFFALYMNTQPDGRDYEQKLPGLSDFCDYLDLVVLAVTGGSNGQRTLLQSLNDRDPCCFYKSLYDQYVPYDALLANVCAANGGVYSLTWDSNMSHNYSPSRRTAIKALFDSY
jgi:hypothetical protein